MDTCSNNCLLPFVSNTIGSIRYQITPNLPGLAYGASDYDVRHNFTANYVYTAKDNWSNPAAKYVLGGWQFAGTIFYHSAYPWSAISTTVRGLNLGNVTPLRNGTPLAAFAGKPQTFGGCGNPEMMKAGRLKAILGLCATVAFQAAAQSNPRAPARPQTEAPSKAQAPAASLRTQSAPQNAVNTTGNRQ